MSTRLLLVERVWLISPLPAIATDTMAEASADAVTTVPCHLEGITRVAFSPDGS